MQHDKDFMLGSSRVGSQHQQLVFAATFSKAKIANFALKKNPGLDYFCFLEGILKMRSYYDDENVDIT